MNPLSRNLEELERMRESIKAGVPLDQTRELQLAEFDDALAEVHYTQDAIDRVNHADEILAQQLGINPDVVVPAGT